MVRNTLFSLLVAAVLLSTGCGRKTLAPVVADGGPSSSNASASIQAGRASGARPFAAWTGGAQHLEGAIGPGTFYSLDVPANWNGDLVTYAHGYTAPQLPVALPNVAALRDSFLSRGYAVATSSFSSNGYALKEGAQQTHQLLGLFASRFGQPQRAWLVGQSLGGIVALKLAETHPQEYAGALLGCGVTGGTRDEVQYIANVRVLFDYFYPDTIPGSLLDVPAGVNFSTQVVPKVVSGILSHPAGAVAMTKLLPIPFANTNELVNSIVQALGFQWLGAADFLDRAHGHVFFDNSQTVYTGALPQPLLDDLNARVERYQATPDAEAFLEHNYEPSGQLEIPVLTLHTTRDPVVPFFNEDRYHVLVDGAGHSDLLFQRPVNQYGHVAYPLGSLMSAFDDLVAWVDTGTKPTL